MAYCIYVYKLQIISVNGTKINDNNCIMIHNYFKLQLLVVSAIDTVNVLVYCFRTMVDLIVNK